MMARLGALYFQEPRPEDYPPREGAFAFRRFITEYHHLYLEVVFGKQGTREFFRLNLGVGPGDTAYDELPLLGDEEGKAIRMPFFRAMLMKKSARVRQRFYNLFLGPRAWNQAASDTFYYTSEADLLARIDSAAALVLRVLPGFMEHLKRNNVSLARLKSPYNFKRRGSDAV